MDAHSRETSKTERTRGRTHQRGNRGASRLRTPLVTVVAGGAAWGVLVGIVLGAWGGGTTKPQAQCHCVLLLRPHPPSTTPVYVGRPGTCLELQDAFLLLLLKPRRRGVVPARPTSINLNFWRFHGTGARNGQGILLVAFSSWLSFLLFFSLLWRQKTRTKRLSSVFARLMRSKKKNIQPSTALVHQSTLPLF